MTDVNAGGAPNGGAATDNAQPGAGGQPNSGGAGEQQQMAFDWGQQGLDQQTLGYVQNKGWKGPGDVLESYRNLEKLHGAPPEQIIKLPKEMTPETMKDVYKRLGQPESAEGYTINVPEGGDPELAKTAAGWFHKAGLNQSQVEAITTMWNEHAANIVKARQQAVTDRDAEQIAALKREWGPQEQANTVLVDRAAKAFGMTNEELMAMRQAMGPASAMKFLHRIGSKLGVDDTFVGGENGGSGFGAMTPAQAQAKIADLRVDKGFMQRWTSGDSDARREWNQLHQFAYPAE